MNEEGAFHRVLCFSATALRRENSLWRGKTAVVDFPSEISPISGGINYESFFRWVILLSNIIAIFPGLGAWVTKWEK